MYKQKYSKRFWEKVRVVKDVNTCWIWLGSFFPDGYGQFYVRKDEGNPRTRNRPAHIVAWELTNGPVPDGKIILHDCDNPPCVRPDHLICGTQADNVRDAADKDRIAHGSRNGNSRLDEHKVKKIRELHAAGLNTVDLERKFKVARTTISSIVRGKIWARVGGPVRDTIDHPLPRRRVLTPEQTKTMISMYSSGYTQQELADEFKVSLATIHNYVIPALGPQNSRRGGAR